MLMLLNCIMYFAAGGSNGSTTGGGHGPFPGGPCPTFQVPVLAGRSGAGWDRAEGPRPRCPGVPAIDDVPGPGVVDKLANIMVML
jgi:hypothetical protein